MTNPTNADGSHYNAPWTELPVWNGKFTAAFADACTIYTKACAEWQQELARFAAARMEKGHQALENLKNCRSPTDLAKAQADWTIWATKDCLDEVARLTEIASQVSRVAMAPLFEGTRSEQPATQRPKAAE